MPRDCDILGTVGFLLTRVDERCETALEYWNKELDRERHEINILVKVLERDYEIVRDHVAVLDSMRGLLPVEWQEVVEKYVTLVGTIYYDVIQLWDANESDRLRLSTSWRNNENPLSGFLDDLRNASADSQKLSHNNSRTIISSYRRFPVEDPAIFFASSSEGAEVMNAVYNALAEKQRDWKLHRWKGDSFFEGGESYLECLENKLPQLGFGIYIMTGDDDLIIRKERHSISRGNVTCEYGMGIGFHGRLRSFVIHPKNLHKPSDLNGITTLTYKPQPRSLFNRRKSHSPPNDEDLDRIISKIIERVEKELAKAESDWSVQ